MAGKPIDWGARISVFDAILKQRPLTKEEEERLDYLVRREKASKRERRYREKNKEKIDKDRKAYSQTSKGRETARKANRKRREEKPHAHRANTLKWKQENPEKWKAILDNRTAERHAIRAKEGDLVTRVDKLAFWKGEAKKRTLTTAEKARVRFLTRMIDPNSDSNRSLREASKRWRDANPGLSAQKGKAWRAANPDKVDAINAAKREKSRIAREKRIAEGNSTPSEPNEELAA